MEKSQYKDIFNSSIFIYIHLWSFINWKMNGMEKKLFDFAPINELLQNWIK